MTAAGADRFQQSEMLRKTTTYTGGITREQGAIAYDLEMSLSLARRFGYTIAVDHRAAITITAGDDVARGTMRESRYEVAPEASPARATDRQFADLVLFDDGSARVCRADARDLGIWLRNSVLPPAASRRLVARGWVLTDGAVGDRVTVSALGYMARRAYALRAVGEGSPGQLAAVWSALLNRRSPAQL